MKNERQSDEELYLKFERAGLRWSESSVTAPEDPGLLTLSAEGFQNLSYLHICKKKRKKKQKKSSLLQKQDFYTDTRVQKGLV